VTRRLLLIAALALLGRSASIAADAILREPATQTVVIEGMQFNPATLTIRAGDSVTWVNSDIVAHTATTPTSAQQRFDSRLIELGKSWKHTFRKAGTYDYVCTYHPTMKGTIKVTATDSTTPAALEDHSR
jgi:plastocyanin